MDTTAASADPVGTTIDDAWVEHHFDHQSTELANDFHPTLARTRSRCPVTHSDQYGGFWVATGYEEVLGVAQDWETFSSAQGITIAQTEKHTILPVTIDPPLQREFRRVINPYFRPVVVAEWEKVTRDLVNRLIDDFIERGECEFMDAFARQLPGLSFFDFALHAPKEDLAQVNEWAMLTSKPVPEARDALFKLAGWISELITERRRTGPRGDVVDAVLAAEIEGRPITDIEAIGTIHLLILGGLDTTAGVLGMAMLRFCAHPEIPELLRNRPDLLTNAVEELIRLDSSFISVARTATKDTEVGGCPIKAGEQVLMYWAAANHDENEFEDPETFDPERARNRHIAFGAGPHRCAGSNLARMNLRIAVEEIVSRLRDIRLAPDADIHWHSTYNRAPLEVPITFTPGPRLSPVD
ncbi:cytochrome P450 [Frankia sp. AgB1.9]|uniref:cytochrome P450 n=1 Tax=unclassified Frankia TaxID=2632575 RepID=UPI001932633C|nr:MULTISPECIES: cytochrome P450 [unclassified Frankia]MBL7488238.1 cytochrome P450 [Frankia sp. AgW1.1]MBL7548119.1 cytochrome P450 [Frankia sp. AgB1.9]MBL7620345.1 cytochrome P450 [Frankia sp. AgB1.8]